jgi:hypothetical protein
VLLNAAAAIVAHDVADGRHLPDAVPGALPAALDAAARSVDSGAATRTLEHWVATSNADEAGDDQRSTKTVPEPGTARSHWSRSSSTSSTTPTPRR